jgi:membrane protein implicated in regulation of membrane protease activity
MNFLSGPPPALLLMVTVLSLATAVTMWSVRQRSDRRRKSESLKAQVDLHLKLLDKISSRDDLREFLESATVRDLLEAHPRAERSEVRRRALDSLVPGCVLTGVGLVFVVTGRDAVRFFGTVGLTIGVGFLLAAFLASRLVRSWDVPGKRVDRPSADQSDGS